ncbi:10025_t:CDS:2 [Paraglomus brasilianum]|uniref:10025_t:CDS:1 n=1 Tax=Paraglomus brasilianum TaxID=144538 RepID=A0A9N8Z4B3_9GLOM|nr:10025_t:CDS:2 [Paraglomus brasilianum]
MTSVNKVPRGDKEAVLEARKRELEFTTTYIENAVIKQKQGKNEDYETIVQTLRNKPETASQLRRFHLWILALSRVAPTLSRSSFKLVDAVLSIDWTGFDDMLAHVYTMFLGNLATGHPAFLKPVLRMLVKGLLLQTERDLHSTSIEKRHERVHHALKYVLSTRPTASLNFVPILSSEFPHKSEPLDAQVVYVQNLLRLLAYAPHLESQLLEKTIQRIIEIDVEIQGRLEDLEELEDEMELYVAELNSTTVDQTIKVIKKDGSIKEEISYDIKEMMEKLDCMIKLVLDYMHWHYKDATAANDFATSKQLLAILLNIYEKFILRTFKSRYTQFIIFWYTGKSLSFAREYLDLLHNIISSSDPTLHPVPIRVAAALYLGSYVARAKYLDGDTVRRSIGFLSKWLKEYVKVNELTANEPDKVANSVFYAVVQATMYVFCFRWKDLMVDIVCKDGITRRRWCSELTPFPHVLASAYKPLEICSRNIVKQFARITNALDFMFVYGLMSDYGESLLSSDGNDEWRKDDNFSTNLDEFLFFPFDPFRLKNSQPYLEGIYQYWEEIDGDEELEEDWLTEEMVLDNVVEW